MKINTFIIVLLVLSSCINNQEINKNQSVQPSRYADYYKQFKNGDIVFQISKSNMTEAIQLATENKYSHVGVVLFQNDLPFVFEASSKVKLTPLLAFINKGLNTEYVIKRADSKKLAIINNNRQMNDVINTYVDKPYDYLFDWSDDAIYCSELVWKVYRDLYKIKLSELRELKDYDLNSDVVFQKLKIKYGDSIPLDAKMVAPSDLYDSELLITVPIHNSN